MPILKHYGTTIFSRSCIYSCILGLPNFLQDICNWLQCSYLFPRNCNLYNGLYYNLRHCKFYSGLSYIPGHCKWNSGFIYFSKHCEVTQWSLYHFLDIVSYIMVYFTSQTLWVAQLSLQFSRHYVIQWSLRLFHRLKYHFIWYRNLSQFCYMELYMNLSITSLVWAGLVIGGLIW